MKSKKKRVLFVVYELPPIGGGVATSAAALLNEYSGDTELKVDVVTSSTTNSYEEKQIAGNIRVHYVPIGTKPPTRLQTQTPLEMMRFQMNSLKTINKLINSHSYDIAHYYGYPSALNGWISKNKVPYLVSLRGVDVPGYNKSFGAYYHFYKYIAALTWKSAQEVTAPSLYLAHMAQQTVPDLKVTVIPNSVDTTLFKPVTDKHKYDVFTITAGGTILGKKKGLSYLLRGFKTFHSNYPDTKVLLFGDGTELQHLTNLSNELKLGSSVEFAGRVDRKTLAQRLPKCHVFCLPSLAEGMSNAMLEAQACKLPIITTPVGSGLELLENKAAVPITIKDSHSITAALEQLYTNRNLRNSLGEKAYQLVPKTWSEVAATYKELYS